MRRIDISIATFMVLAVAQPCLAMVSTSQFQQWYPQYGFIFASALKNNCTEQYARYLTGDQNPAWIDYYGGGGTISVLTQPVVLCILDHTSEYVKSIMASAQVALGLMPTMLAIVGASHEELALLGCIGRRPLLAFLLALGSPSVYLSRAFEYHDPAKILKKKSNVIRQYPLGRRASRLVSVAEYTLAMVAVANVALLNYDLGIKTVCSWMSDMVLAPMLYSVLGLVIHIGGAIAMRLRARREPVVHENQGDLEVARPGGGSYSLQNVKEVTTPLAWVRDFPRRLREIIRYELVPCVSQTGLCVRVFPERKWYILFAWLLSTGIVVVIVFGTLMFSALTFIGPKDAMGVVARYLASTLACRIVLMYELAGMRQSADVLALPTPEESHGSENGESKSVDSLYIQEVSS